MLRPFVVPRKSSTTHIPYVFISLIICLHKLSYRNSLKSQDNLFTGIVWVQFHLIECTTLTSKLNYFPLNSHCTLASCSQSIVCIRLPSFAGQSLNWLWQRHLALPLCHSFDDEPLSAVPFSYCCLRRLRRLSMFGRRNLQRNRCWLNCYLFASDKMVSARARAGVVKKYMDTETQTKARTTWPNSYNS